MILSLLTAFVPAAVAVLPELSRSLPILIDAQENCRFRAGASQYDLCPVFENGADRPFLVTGKGTEVYRFNLIPNGDSGPHLCSSGTRICLINPSRPPQEISGISCIISVDPRADDINLLFKESDESATARVQFVCDPQAEMGLPILLGVQDTLHSFIWRSRYACRLGAQASGSILSVMDADSDAPSPPEPAEPDDDSDQLLEGDRQRKSRRSTAFIFLVIFIFITSISMISYKYPDRFNFLLTEYIKPVFHRLSLDSFPRISIPRVLKPTGEGRLVRWAHEDLELDEDLMVNSNDVYDEPDDMGDEYIPLRPSPRKGGRVIKNYGSALSPFW
ncbi:hypothetical protein B0H15DRAFT_856563 [Mycena belliarum]|uniref:MRH domain-containing protein n=1 Tax=Mycena belliarum TaxID=1033014 RepID=A0AAD6TYA7_9AGAR|nr:hypothetical protein B0H15DRAFT_856563 [Mycena belliae]